MNIKRNEAMMAKMNFQLDLTKVKQLMILDAAHAAMLQWEIDGFETFDPVNAYLYVVMCDTNDDHLVGLIDDLCDGDRDSFIELLELIESMMNNLLPIR